MNQSNYSEKEPGCCCSDCHVYFKNYEDLEAHRKNDCPEIFKTPLSSAVPSDVTANTSKTSRQTQVDLSTDHSTPATLSSIEVLNLAMKSKRIALEAFGKGNKEFECAAIAYKKIVQKKRETFKAYCEDRNREKDLTANSEEGKLRNCQRRLQMFLEAEAILKEEEDAERRLQQALSKQKTASEVNSLATTWARTALIDAEKSSKQLKEKSTTPTLQSQTKGASEIEEALIEIPLTLQTCGSWESQYQDLVNTTMKEFLMVKEATRYENAIFLMERGNENSVASTNCNQQERVVPDCSQFQQMMDDSQDVVRSSTDNLDMNPSNYSEKEPDCCCSDCHVNFKSYKNLEAHRKKDCPKIFKMPFPNPSDVITNTSKTSRQTQVDLSTDHSTPATLSCIEGLNLAMKSKRIALEAFGKENKEFECAMIAYKEVVQKKRETFKAYCEDRNREKGLTENSEEENLRNDQRRLQMFSEAEAILEEEEDAERRLQGALCKQKAASEVNSMATIRARSALNEAEKFREQLKEQRATPTLHSRTKYASKIEEALIEIPFTLESYGNWESQYQDLVNTTMKEFLMVKEATRIENAVFLVERRNEISVASTSGNQQESPGPECSQFQQMMDVSTLSDTDDGDSSTSESDEGNMPDVFPIFGSAWTRV